MPGTDLTSLAAYVKARGGRRVLSKILIANNGIAAVKAIRSIRQWAYEVFGNEREVLFCVMTTPEDLKANAEYIRMADQFVEVPGGPNNNNYANVRLIVETAEAVGADAVWAGWGHASENPSLPESLSKAARPIVFIGPPPGPMHALGDKIGSTIIAQSAGVPCLPWNGAALRVNYREQGLPPDVYQRADVQTVEEAVAAAESVGFPLMVKASEGGGGKGIRKVLAAADLPDAFRQVRAEVPGSPVFLMALASRARHLEVQLLADEYGQAMACFGRDCSVQRRHQKIVEEGPVLAAPPETWAAMELAAVRLAKEVGYVNAGTVEYLYMEDPEEEEGGAATADAEGKTAPSSRFAFLELNPRLQVEHPVTEMITGLNLPAAQLQVAMGIPLHHIPEVRRLYGRGDIHLDVHAPGFDAGAAAIDFETETRVKPQGHVIAARITAENPDSGFQPTSGAVTELNFRSTPDVWGYFSVDSSGRVHEFADSQIGHLFAWGASREDARQHMVVALKELSIRGDIRTTVEYLVGMMESDDFRSNRISTAWLDARIQRRLGASKPDPLLVAVLGAVWRGQSAYEARRGEFVSCLARGQYPSPSLLSVDDPVELIYEGVKYCMRVTRAGPAAVTVSCNGSLVTVQLRALSDGGLLVLLNGRSHVLYARQEAGGLRLVLDGTTCVFSSEYDPSTLQAPMSGKLARFLVEDGASVRGGQPYAEVEVMKMYLPLTAPEAGRIHLLKPEGCVLEPGDVIARVELDDPSKVQRVETFNGSLAELTPVPGGSYSMLGGGVGGGGAVSDGRLPSPLTDEAKGATSFPPNGAAAATETIMAAKAAPAQRTARRWHTVARSAQRTLSLVLQGFAIPRDALDAAWLDRDAAFSSPDLPLCELEDTLSPLASRLPAPVTAALQAVIAEHKARLAALDAAGERGDAVAAPAATSSPFPTPGGAAAATVGGGAGGASGTLSPEDAHAALAARFRARELDMKLVGAALDAHAAGLTPREAAAFEALAAPLRALVLRFRDGVEGAGRASLHALVSEYLAVERLFGEGRRPEDVVADLRAAALGGAAAPGGGSPAGGDASTLSPATEAAVSKVFDTLRAHMGVKGRNAVVLATLARIAEEIELQKGRRTSSTSGSLGGSTSAKGGASGAAAGGAAATGAAGAPAGGIGSSGASAHSAGSQRSGAASPASGASITDDGAGGADRDRDRAVSVADSRAEGDDDDDDFDTIDITQPAAPKTGAAATSALADATAAGSALAPTTLKGLFPLLHLLAELRGPAYATVTLEARQILITAQQPSQRQRRLAVGSLLAAMGAPETRRLPGAALPAAADESGAEASTGIGEDALTALVDDDQPLLDVLTSFFLDHDPIIRRNAGEVYIRRLYRMFTLTGLTVSTSLGSGVAEPEDEDWPLGMGDEDEEEEAAAAAARERGVGEMCARWTFSAAQTPIAVGEAAGPDALNTSGVAGGVAGGTLVSSPSASGGASRFTWSLNTSGSSAALPRYRGSDAASVLSATGSETGGRGPNHGSFSSGRDFDSPSPLLQIGTSFGAAPRPGGLRPGPLRAVMTAVESSADLFALAQASPPPAALPGMPSLHNSVSSTTLSSGGGAFSPATAAAQAGGTLSPAGAPLPTSATDGAEPYIPPTIPRHGAMSAFANLQDFKARALDALCLVHAGPGVRTAHALELGRTCIEVEQAAAEAAAAAGRPPPRPRTPPIHVLHVTLLRSPTLDPGFMASVMAAQAGGAGSSTTTSGGGDAWSGGRRRMESSGSAAGLGLGGGVDASGASSLRAPDDETLERAVVEALSAALQPLHFALRALGIRRVTFNVPNPKGVIRTSHTPIHDAALAYVAATSSQVGACIPLRLHGAAAAAMASSTSSAGAEAGGGGGGGGGSLPGTPMAAGSSSNTARGALLGGAVWQPPTSPPMSPRRGPVASSMRPPPLVLPGSGLGVLSPATSYSDITTLTSLVLSSLHHQQHPTAAAAAAAAMAAANAGGASSTTTPSHGGSASGGLTPSGSSGTLAVPGAPASASSAAAGASPSSVSLTPAQAAELAAAAHKLAHGHVGGGNGGSASGFPWIYTFRSSLGWDEDAIVRHIEPPASAHLEIARLSNFRIRMVPVPNRIIHVYAAVPRSAGGKEGAGADGKPQLRYFVRVIVRQTARIPTLGAVYEQYPGPERMFVECLDALALAMGDALQDTSSPVGHNHIFLNVLPVTSARPEYMEAVTKILARRYADRLRRLRVAQVEVKFSILPNPNAPPVPLRLVSSNPTGYVLRVDTYVEAREDPSVVAALGGSGAGSGSGSGGPIFMSIAPAALTAGLGLGGGANGAASRPGSVHMAQAGTGILASLGLSSIHRGASPQPQHGRGLGGLSGLLSDPYAPHHAGGLLGAGGAASASYGRGEWDGLAVSTPYPITSTFERQRALAAALSDTLYVYDFLELFTRALEQEWTRYERSRGGAGFAPARRPRTVLHATELVLRRRGAGAAGAGGEAGNAAAAATGGLSTPLKAAGAGAASAGLSGARLGGAGLSSSVSGGGVASGGPAVSGGSAGTASSSAASGGSSASPSVTYDVRDWELVEANRPPGQNEVGMVAWRVTLFTPQYPEEAGGRELVLIANDITFRAGSFGTGEDVLFALASAYARERGLPRVYLAANSGARIGLAEELKKLFKIAWVDPADPPKGYRYLYLTQADYEALVGAGVAGAASGSAGGGSAGGSGTAAGAGGASSAAAGSTPSSSSAPPPPVLCRPVVEDGETRWVITDIIGRESDLGVENLRGSGLIAGETARAYESSFTLTYVTGRTVGIGAYLVRLGHRCIQKAGSGPIILTGYEALNKLMGSEVYTSNLQLGGPKIMGSNGISHETVDNDYEGVRAVLKWLAYVPKAAGAPLPVMDTTSGDDADRDVGWEPPPAPTPFDPRHMLTGAVDPATGAWTPGLFDRDTWREAMGGWAKSVITGRARLGGIPVGVIVPEVRTTQAVVPADPASPESKETVVPQAGQVWFPDSAYKTATAIRDFTGEGLPIIVLANWRGFSGGARDMFDSVLKYGSMIVDAFVHATTPVLVYIPPRGELRGGAWVVLDPTINPDVMEMFADPSARGGVLEPAGTAAIKFRQREILATAHRLDPLLRSLDAQLRAATSATAAAAGGGAGGASGASGAASSSSSTPAALRRAIKAREEALSGVYLQVVHTFADLHDTPGRMLAKGVIGGVVPWKRARAHLYWRLRRRLAERGLIRRLRGAAPQLTQAHAVAVLRSWFAEGLSTGVLALGGVRAAAEQGGDGSGVAAAGPSAAAAAAASSAAGGDPWGNDVLVLRWLAETRDVLEARVQSLRREAIMEDVLSLGLEDPAAVVAGVVALLSRLSPDRREAAVASLRRVVLFSPSANASPGALGGGYGGGGVGGLLASPPALGGGHAAGSGLLPSGPFFM